MRRIDRILGDARLLRIKRAARAQAALLTDGGMVDSDSSDVAQHDDVEDIVDEREAETRIAQRILSDLSETQITQDSRRKDPINIIDHDLLGPLVDKCTKAVLAIFEEDDPKAIIFADLYPKVCRMIASNADPARIEQSGVARRSAVMDVAVLVSEMVLFDVIDRVMLHHDRTRPVAINRDPDLITIKGNRIYRREDDRPQPPLRPKKETKGQKLARQCFAPYRESQRAKKAEQAAILAGDVSSGDMSARDIVEGGAPETSVEI